MRLGPPKVLVQLQVPLETYTTLMEGKPDTQSRNAFFLALIEESRQRRELQENTHEYYAGSTERALHPNC